MKRHTRTALGIDVGERRIGIALVERGKQGCRIVAAAGGDLPPGEIGRPESSHGKVLSRLLSQLGGRTRLRGTKAALALSLNSLAIQLLDLPKHVPANIGEFVKGELQQYVALSGKNVISDFCGVGSGGQKRLLAVAADVDEIQERVTACSATGIVVDRVEPSTLAYARVCQELQKAAPQSGDSLLAMLGPRLLTVGLFRRGTLDYVRLRSLPAEASSLSLLCIWLAEELRAVARYYDTQISPAGRDWRTSVVLHDGVHQASELAPLLAAETGNESLVVVDACEVPASPLLSRGDSLPERVSMVAVGAALGLLGVEAGEPQINLLPQAVTEARSLSRHVLVTAIVGIAAFLGVFVTTQLLARTTSAVDRKIEQAKLSGQLYAAPALIAEEKFLDQEISRIRQHLDPLRKVIGSRPAVDWPDILHAIRQATPVNVWLTQLQGSDGRVLSLKGFTPSCPAAQAFVRNLEEQSPFASVTLTLVQRRQNTSDRLEYQIDCLLKTKGEKPS